HPPGPGQPQPASPPPPPPPPSHQPTEPRWDDPPVWDPLPPSTGLGGSPVTYGQPEVTPPPAASDRTRLTASEYETEYRPSDWTPPPSDGSPITRSVVVGVVGLIVIVLASMFFGRKLGIIGPGAERHCVITMTPVEDGEGEVEELLCVDGYGKEVRREILTP